MLEALDQKARWTGMACVARTGCLDVVNRFRSGTYATPSGVASCAIFRRVFEDAIHMTLFAPQGGMHISQQKTGFRVIKRGDAGCRVTLDEQYDAKQRARQHRRCYLSFCVGGAHRYHLPIFIASITRLFKPPRPGTIYSC